MIPAPGVFHITAGFPPPSVLFPLHSFSAVVGLVVKASASRAEGPGFESSLRRDFFGVESYQ